MSTNVFSALLVSRNQTERDYAFGKVFRFRNGQKKTLPRSQRYPKRLADFMNLLDKEKIPFCIECIGSENSPLARLIFKG